MHWQLGLLAVFINGLVAFFFLIGDIGLLEYKLKTVFEESLCQTYGSCLPLNAKYNHLPDVKLTVYFSTLSKLRTILDVWTIFLKIVKSVIQTFVLLKWASEILCTALCYDIETELWSRNLLATPCGHGYQARGSKFPQGSMENCKRHVLFSYLQCDVQTPRVSTFVFLYPRVYFSLQLQLQG